MYSAPRDVTNESKRFGETLSDDPLDGHSRLDRYCSTAKAAERLMDYVENSTGAEYCRMALLLRKRSVLRGESAACAKG